MDTHLELPQARPQCPVRVTGLGLGTVHAVRCDYLDLEILTAAGKADGKDGDGEKDREVDGEEDDKKESLLSQKYSVHTKCLLLNK